MRHETKPFNLLHQHGFALTHVFLVH